MSVVNTYAIIQRIFTIKILQGDEKIKTLIEKIEKLKKEKDITLLAHYYVDEEIKAVADFIGDSYYLAKKAREVPNENIMMCGVSFMGESVKILNPEKTVLMPDIYADCPMAHMVSVEDIEAIRKKYDDLAVVAYINSTAEIKVHADVCVTSANAVKIVKALDEKNIYFIPDENLGRYIARELPEKNFIFNQGYCHVHRDISREDVESKKKSYPRAKVLAHPECKLEVLDMADYIASTSGIIEYANESDAEEFIVCTETGIFYELRSNNPNKKFYPAKDTGQICPGMKKNTLVKIGDALESFNEGIEIEKQVLEKSLKSLEKMLELAK